MLSKKQPKIILMNKDEKSRLIYGTLNQVINEVEVLFNNQNAKLVAAVSAL